MSRTKAFAKEATPGIKVSPDVSLVGHGIYSNMPTPIEALPEQPEAISPLKPHGIYSYMPTPIDPVVLAPIEEFPQPDPTVKWDPTTKWDTSIDGGIVCFIPPGTVHEYLPSEAPATPGPIFPPVQPADLNDLGPPDVLYYEPPVAAPPEYPMPEGPWSGPYPVPEGPWTGPEPVPEGPSTGPEPVPEGPWTGLEPVPESPWTGPQPVPEDKWTGPYPAPTPEPDPIGVHLDDGGFVVYIDENGNAVCGYPPPGYGGGTVSQPVEPLPPLTIDGEGTISHNPVDPNGPAPIQPLYGGVVDMGDDDIQSAINDFIHSTTVKVPVKDVENVAQPVPVAPDTYHDNGIMPPEHGPTAPEVFM